MRTGKKKTAPVPLIIAFVCASGTVLPQNQLAPMVSKYCIACHNSRISEGKVSFDTLDAERPWADADTWERVLRQLRARTMPPRDAPRPDPKRYEIQVSALAAALDRGDPQKAVTPPQPVTDLELAARLSNLLWNAAPDAALLDVARKGRLHNPVILETEVRRMLADAKVAGLVSGFFREWLGLNQLATMPSDGSAFP